MSTTAQFIDAMARAGIVTDDPIIDDGQLHRIHLEGHRRGTKNGAYILHGDRHPAGWYQDFVSGVTGTWRANGGNWQMDANTRRLIEADRARRKAETEERHQRKAAEAWRLYSPAADATDSHPYLHRKGVKAHPGLRVATWRKWHQDEQGQWREIVIPDALLVPVIAPETGKLVNLQAILPEPHPDLGRDKDFLGGRKAGCLFWLGSPTATLLIAEGYATAASLHERTGHQTFVAFDAGNLKAVALAIRTANPDAKIIVCADDDRHTPGNPGVTKGREAALAAVALLSIPPFDDGEHGTDWNDYYASRRGSWFPQKSEFHISPLGASRAEGGANA